VSRKAGLALALLVVVAADRALAGMPVASSGTAPRLVVGCDGAVGLALPATPGANQRVLFDRIAVAGENDVAKPLRHPGLRPFPFVTKSGFLVHRGRTPVDLMVPRAWRTRYGIGTSSAVRILGCNRPPKWWAYASVFMLRRPACIPLIVRVDGRSTIVRFAVGRAC
jgi:hypothetical protein